MRSTSGLRVMALIAVALLALSACGGDDNGGDGGGGEAAAGECGGSGGTTLSISADNTEFDTDELTAPAGEQVTVEFENKDSVAHTFTVSDLDCDTGNVDGGSTAELSFTMPDAETEFVCTIHSNMTGTLVPE